MAIIAQTAATEGFDVICVEQPALPVQRLLRRLAFKLVGLRMRPRLRRAVLEIEREGRPALMRYVEEGRRVLRRLHARAVEAGGVTVLSSKKART